MSLFLGRSEKRLASTFPEPTIPPFLGADSGGMVSIGSKPDVALTIPTVWACVSLLAGTVASLPLVTLRKQSAVNAIPQRLPEPAFVRNPDRSMTQSEWLHMVMVSLLLRGNCYGRITERDPATMRPSNVTLLNPDRVALKVRDDGSRFYEINNGRGTTEDVAADNMWHVRGLTMPGALVGLSPISYAAATLGVDLHSRQFASGFFEGGGIPKAIIESDQQIDDTMAMTIKARVMATFRGREPLVLGIGSKYNQIQVSPEESQFLATQAANVGQIARYFNVPAEMVGGQAGGSMCVDTETEMLTTRGWLRYDQIEVGDTCLTLNTETQLAEWQPVTGMYVFDGPHQMLRANSTSHSSMTTLNHRWPVLREGADGMSWRESQTMVSSDRVLAAAPVANLPVEPKWSDALVETVAWFYTEGWVGKYGEVRIAQSHKVNPTKCARIRAALLALFGPECEEKHVRSRPAWIEGKAQSGVTHFRLNKLAAAILHEVAPGKVPTAEFLTQLTRAQLDLFIHTSLIADGSVTNTGTPVLLQKDLRRLEAFQIACALTGRSGVIRQNAAGMWSFGVRQSAMRKPKGHNEYLTTLWTSEKVWCPTTPNQTWFARRDGTTYFTGNTYSNREQRGIDFLTYHLSFWLKRIEDAMFSLLPGTQFVQFDTTQLLRADIETQTRVEIQQLAGKMIAPSELRAKHGLPPMTPAQKTEVDLVPLIITPAVPGVKGTPGLHDVAGPEAPVPTNDQQGAAA